jgi:hypothetical protein
MSEPIIQRFSMSASAPDLTGSSVHEYHWRQWGGVFFTRIHGYRVPVLDLANRQDLKDAYNFQLLSDLSTPATKLPQNLLTFLAAQGIVPAAGDTLLNVLRAIRDKYESNSPNPFGFDISQ